MALIRSKKGLILYPLLLSLFTTTLALGLILQPKAGWGSWLADVWSSMGKTNSQAVNSFTAAPTQMTQYKIQAELDTSNSVIHGISNVSVPNAPDNKLLFYLYPATFKPIQIEQVLVNGRNTAFTSTPEELTIPLKEKGATANVQIRFTTYIPLAGTRLGQKDGVWSLTYWYPILGVRQNNAWIPRPIPHPFGDPYLMDLSSYQVELKYPANFRWYTSGTLVSTQNENEIATSIWKSDNIRNFALIGGTGWNETKWKTEDGIDVTVASRKPQQSAKLQSITETAVKIYTKRFGSLAYPSFSVVEMPAGTVYAHEYPNLALFSEDIWNWTSGEHWIAHEIAHAWWYSSVGTYKALMPWLDEGLAEYSALLYLEAESGSEAYKETINRNWSLLRDGKSYAPHHPESPIKVWQGKTDQPYANFDNEIDYYYLMYLRPQLMYHDLRVSMGDKKFFDFLQQFYLKNRNKTATRGQLEEALKQVDPSQLDLLKMWLDAPNAELVEKVKERFK